MEEPTEVFQKIRDFSDSLLIYKDLEENDIKTTTQNQKQFNNYVKKQKICKRQAQRVFDILECVQTQTIGYKEYLKFTESIKTRITNEIEVKKLKITNKIQYFLILSPEGDTWQQTSLQYGQRGCGGATGKHHRYHRSRV